MIFLFNGVEYYTAIADKGHENCEFFTLNNRQQSI